MQCFACKNQQSWERCGIRSVPGFSCCRRHLKTRHTRMWISQFPCALLCIRRFQALWRGYSVRIPLKLAGPGVLRRSLCNNDEDVSTLDSKTGVHPFDYFSIVESGKVFWFDQRTMVQWAQKELEIQNPWTRTPIPVEDLRRFRKLCEWRRLSGRPMYHEGQPAPMTATERRDGRWLRIAQLIRECGFDVHHENFISFSYPQLSLFVSALMEDMRLTAAMKPTPAYLKHLLWIKNIRNVMHTYPSLTHVSTDVAGILMAIFQQNVKSPDNFAFSVYSAFSRSEAFF